MDSPDRDEHYRKPREEWLRSMSGTDSNAPHPTAGYQQIEDLFRTFSRSAQEYAASSELGLQSYEKLLRQVYEIVHALSHCFVQWDEETKKPIFWLHRRRIVMDIGCDKDPYIDKASLESLVDSYLQLPIRCATFERCIVDGLVAAEIFAFASEVLVPPRWHNTLGTSRLRGLHVVPATVINGLILIVVLGGLGALAALGNSFAILPGNILGWVSGILFGLLVILLTISFCALPFAWWRQRKQRKKIGAILREMIHAYSELDADGPVSAARFERALEKAVGEGAVWPSPVFVLVEDIKSGRGRF